MLNACEILTCHCLCSVDLLPHTSAVDPVFYPAFRDSKPNGFSCPMLIFSAPVKLKTIRFFCSERKSFGRNWIRVFVQFYLFANEIAVQSSFSLARFDEVECTKIILQHSIKQNRQTSERETKRREKADKHVQHRKRTQNPKQNKNTTQFSRFQCSKHFIFNI